MRSEQIRPFARQNTNICCLSSLKTSSNQIAGHLGIGSCASIHCAYRTQRVLQYQDREFCRLLEHSVRQAPNMHGKCVRYCVPSTAGPRVDCAHQIDRRARFHGCKGSCLSTLQHVSPEIRFHLQPQIYTFCSPSAVSDFQLRCCLLS